MDAPPPDDTPEPANPTDTPLRHVSDQLSGAGEEGQFRAVEGSRIQCLTCRHEAAAEEFRSADGTRLEGASDPADMVMVVPVTCPACAVTGSLILGYGPNVSAEDADASVRHGELLTGSPGRERTDD